MTQEYRRACRAAHEATVPIARKNARAARRNRDRGPDQRRGSPARPASRACDDRLRAVLDADLVEDRRDVIAHGLLGELEVRGDLQVVVPARDVLEDLPLAAREVGERGGAPVRRRRTKASISSITRSNDGSPGIGTWLRVSSGTSRAPGIDEAMKQPLVERRAHVAARVQHQRRTRHLRQVRRGVDVAEARDDAAPPAAASTTCAADR